MPPSSSRSSNHSNSSIHRHDQDSLVLFAACYISFVCTGIFPSPDADSTLRLAATIDRVVSATLAPSATLLVSLIHLERLRSARAAEVRASSSDARASWRFLQSANSPDHIAIFTAEPPASKRIRGHRTPACSDSPSLSSGGATVNGKQNSAAASSVSSSSPVTITPTISARLHRIWSASFILADCTMNDNAFTCKSWSIVTGYSPDECVALKRAFLLCLDYDVWIGSGEYNTWLGMFRGRVKAAAAAASANPSASNTSYFYRQMERALGNASVLASAANARANDEVGPEYQRPDPAKPRQAPSATAPTREPPAAVAPTPAAPAQTSSTITPVSTGSSKPSIPAVSAAAIRRLSSATGTTAANASSVTGTTASPAAGAAVSAAAYRRRSSFITSTAAAEAANLAAFRRRSSILPGSAGTAAAAAAAAAAAGLADGSKTPSAQTPSAKSSFANPLPAPSPSAFVPRRMSSSTVVERTVKKRPSSSLAALEWTAAAV
ncbi:hypothetical protein DFJ73DRAFT_774282 [Zopfochytrium polystomum]|nr:hypothetical protein DFJ73DRAFT_774282 [Zopfochytrium polystomum]